MACCLAHVVARRKKGPRPRTLENVVKAAEMFRQGCTLARIGDAFCCSREWARRMLVIARQQKIMQDEEYDALKGKVHYESAQRRWAYFCDVAENIEHFDKDKFNELKAKYWAGERDPAARAAYAERSCLEWLVRKKDITESEARLISYLLCKFKQSKTTLAQLKDNALYFMNNKSISLKDFALERRIGNNNRNPAMNGVRQIVSALGLGIISSDDYAVRALANFYRVFSTVRKPAPGWKYPEHRLKFVLNAHEKTGLPYARIARFAEVPVQAVYDYKLRQNKLH